MPSRIDLARFLIVPTLVLAACDSRSSSSDDAGDGAVEVQADGGPSSPIACEASCSDHGRCVMVDSAETCACESGYYEVGLACLADPCESGGTCRYVDSTEGADSNPGTKEAPWRSLAKVAQEIDDLAPGAYVLFARGGSWSNQDITINANGTEDEPITIGAYGPHDLARPVLRQVRIRNSEHVILRDVESTGSLGGPCIPVTESGHITVQDTVVHDCQNNGIMFGSRTHHGVLIDNYVYSIDSNDALSIHSPTTLTAETRVGDHFWVVDNRVPGPVAEEPIDVATGNDTVVGSRDIKIVGNVVGSGRSGCIVTGHGTSVVWIVGNTLGNCPTSETAAALRVGGTHGALSGTDFQIRGNVIFWNQMSSALHGQEPAVPGAIIEQNTIVTGIGKRPVWRNQVPDARVTFERNILWTTGGQAHVAYGANGITTDPVAITISQDHNWYVPGSKPGCEVAGRSLADWQSTGLDASSSCGQVPGLELPTAASVADFDGWTSAAFRDRFIPDASWEGCTQEVGAFTCDGAQRVRFDPFPSLADNGGYGWEGPRVVKQRYRIGPTAE